MNFDWRTAMSTEKQKIVADISMYPLSQDYIPAIVGFIKSLRNRDGLEVVTNQLSTQLRGEFEVVTGAISDGMKVVMSGPEKVVFTVKYINADLEIGRLPNID
jgi:uncharacterized protein YqgV (UPF0045/DUF77 family)